MTREDRYRLGIDIGGTFTDFVLVDDASGTVTLHKCLTTPDDPSIGALHGTAEIIEQAGIDLRQVEKILHGTTLVTNAIIERRGAGLGLITTAGFRDLLEMGTEQRYDIYDLFLEFPEPLVPRRHRLDVTERMSRDGDVVQPLDLAGLKAAVDRLVADDIGAVAICFLHSYRNSAHEQAAGRAIRDWYPDLAVSLSFEVVAELWEYQRTVTTCANAYVQPLMDRYLRRLEGGLAEQGFGGELLLMHSAGGLLSPEVARRYPIRLLESGPAGGGLATAFFGERAGKSDVISFDMGGTTAKACLIENGKAEVVPMMEAARVHRFKRGSGLPIKAPVIDMIEIGAGGGSIAWIDEVGLLRVGPRSAGADPGPACYGKGGIEPTVTDANLVLGYYQPSFFLGGRMSLDVAAAEQALGKVAKPLGLSVREVALGIHRIVTEQMAAAARVHLIEKGKDPRAHAMIGFGGAGPAHVAEVARILGVGEVMVPPASGAASALGFLTAPLAFEQVRSLPMIMAPGFDATLANQVLADLEGAARQQLMTAGVDADEITIERSADMRLFGQLHEIEVPWPAGSIDEQSLETIRERFAAVYTQRYTSLYTGALIQVISFRVRAAGRKPDLVLETARAGGEAADALKGRRLVWFGSEPLSAAVYDRYALLQGASIEGPAIIEEREATTIIPPGDRADVDEVGNLRIRVESAPEAAAMVTPEMPVAEAAALIDASPIALEIMWSRLEAIVEEMWLTICRTAFSLIISEAQDFACELVDPHGEPLAHSPRAMPVFNIALPRVVKALLEHFPPETLEPGDVLVTNDPWLCAGHLFDIAIVTPVFRDGVLVALLGTVGHVSDIGGTKDSLRAREIYDEGLQIPPMKLVKAGAANDDLFALIAENVRNPNQVLGDIHAFIAANKLGTERLLAFMAEYGMHDLRALASVVQGRAEAAMRAAIGKLPDGVYSSEVWCNPQGERLRFPLELAIAGDEITLDFSGAPAELAQGGLNCTLNYTAAHATYPLKCMLTPRVRSNAGCFRPFHVKVPEGSALNCSRPMAVNLRTRIGWYLAPNVFRAMAEAAPDLVQAHTGLPVAVNIYGRDAEGRIYSDHLFMGGGQGASLRKDGKSALLWPTSAANTSVELFETRVPVLVLEKAYATASGGAGRHRGGLGTRVRLQKLYDDGLETLFSVYPEGVGIELDGLFGGQAGLGALGVVRQLDGSLDRDCGTGELVAFKRTDRIVEVVLGGGSGYGDPAERSDEDVARDLADGYVSE
ncbi:MAG: hydantoinase B/oxoprolinase family protein [Alphaproteobacteria bacterium]